MYFDGKTYDPALDKARLGKLIYKVWSQMSDGGWHTLGAISAATGGSEASVSARLRDYRKPRFGSHTVDRVRVRQGLWKYRVIPNFKVQPGLFD